MKKNRLLILLLIAFITMNSSSLPKEAEYSIEAYVVDCNRRYLSPTTIENIERRYSYYFKSSDIELFELEHGDSSALKNRLDSFKIVEKETNYCFIRIVINHNKKVFEIYYNIRGNYYYNKKWHETDIKLFSEILNLIPKKYLIEY